MCNRENIVLFEFVWHMRVIVGVHLRKRRALTTCVTQTLVYWDYGSLKGSLGYHLVVLFDVDLTSLM